jgi:hypothetical protein
MFQIRIRIH